MKDAFHGSARPAHGLVTDHRDHPATIIRPYRGTDKRAPHRGTAHTAPKWIQRAAGGHGFERLPRIVLDVDVHWGAIPCWSGRAQRWANETVPAAFRERYDTHVRPAMPNNPVSLKSWWPSPRRAPPSPSTVRAATAGPPTSDSGNDRAVRADRPARIHRATPTRGGHRGDARTPANPRGADCQLAGRRPGQRVGFGLGLARQSDSNAVTPSRRV